MLMHLHPPPQSGVWPNEILAHKLHTIKWKHLQIKIELSKFQECHFILQKKKLPWDGEVAGADFGDEI